jgi:stage V sporulation protein B
VAVLTLSTLVVKLIGLLYKIPMMRYLGEEGMGYFNSAYEIYTFFYILATAGLPVAVSILVAERAEKGSLLGVKRIFSVSLALFVVLGLAGTAVLYFGAEKFSELIENSGALLSIAAIAPMVLFVCVSSAVRGYFQGHQNMLPTAISQIIEAAG